jgi:perosamine synthetase
MAATTIAVLNVGAVPVFCDVDDRTWQMAGGQITNPLTPAIVVSLYGLCEPRTARCPEIVDDAAQTLRRHSGAAFTSYSFQASKILSTGEGGMLVTDNEALAMAARSYLSLGYAMAAGQARIDSSVIKAPTFERHHLASSINGRMSDITAQLGLERLARADAYKATRQECAAMYRDAITDCDWLVPQYVPDGWTHDYWAYAVACDTPQRALDVQARMAALGGEIPYGAWRLTFQEPAFAHLNPLLSIAHLSTGTSSATNPPAYAQNCPNAQYLQPRLLQFQTNHLASAERNANALRRVIAEMEP